MSKVKKMFKPDPPKAPPMPEKINSAHESATGEIDRKKKRAAGARASGRTSLLSGAATGVKSTLG